MGQANRRGTFEERLSRAQQRNAWVMKYCKANGLEMLLRDGPQRLATRLIQTQTKLPKNLGHTTDKPHTSGGPTPASPTLGGSPCSETRSDTPNV